MKRYINPKVLKFLSSPCWRVTLVGGRAVGKTHGLGLDHWACYNELPRGKVLQAALTYAQLLNITLPEMEFAWNRMGLTEYDPETKTGDYIIGKAPPSFWHKPYKKPHKHKYAIYFSNGYCITMGSLDAADSLRGGSYTGLRVDESALVREDDFNKVLLPMVRDSEYAPYSDSRLFNSVKDITSMPWKLSGQWVFKTEENMQKEKVARLKLSPDIRQATPREYEYIEAKTRDNRKALPGGYIKRLKELLTEIEYLVEVENMRLNRVPNSFYPNFEESRHCVFETYTYDDGDRGVVLSGDKFYDPDEELDISFDFNAAFFSSILGQDAGNEYRIIDELYVSNYRTIDELLDKFINKYQGHQRRKVNIYGDRGGHSRIGLTETTFFQHIENRFRAADWTTRMYAGGSYPNHKSKHQMINGILAERKDDRLPKIRINQNNCKYLIISIQNAPITMDFKKDKSSERKETDRRKATDLSDAFDYLITKKFSRYAFGSGSMKSVII